MSILKRIEDIVLATESKLRNRNHPEADPSDLTVNKKEDAASQDSHAEPEGDLQMELELVEC